MNLKIELDSSALLAELKALVDLTDEFPEVSNVALEILDHPAKFCNVRNVATVGTGVCLVIFEPGDFLVGFMAALRALKGKKLVIEVSGTHTATV
jgi:hypothetical protein